MKKVLILEDEVNIRSFVVINLKRAGYYAVEAGTGQDALDKLRQNPDIGVAILDIMLPDIDAQLPSSLSPSLVQGFLREQLGYDGVLFTDDLCMGAIANHYCPAQSVALALKAGCDLPLVCHRAVEHLEAIAEAVSQLPAALLEDVERRVSRFRMMLTSMPPMRFIEWREYLKDVAAFTASVPEVDPSAPSSPVLDY